MTHLRLGTRGSPLALYQANTVANLIQAATGEQCEIVVIRTSGDRLAEAALSEIGGKRLFVKEIEDALLDGRIDLAVHSSKDMPVVLPDGLVIAATLPREDPRDALVLPTPATPAAFDETLARLGPSPRIGTSSVRRVAQLARLVPGAVFVPIRGNLDTRLAKLQDGHSDAIVLASAGLTRLGQRGRISASIPSNACVPAPGQGIIAVEVRADDRRSAGIVASIDNHAAHAALRAERALVEALGGGCHMPIGGLASIERDRLTLTAVVASLDGARLVKGEQQGIMQDAHDIGYRTAHLLLGQGAAAILAEAAQQDGVPGGQLS